MILGMSYNGCWFQMHVVPCVQYEGSDVAWDVIRLDWIGWCCAVRRGSGSDVVDQTSEPNGPWMRRGLPLCAYAAGGGKLHMVHRNQAARTRLATTPFLLCIQYLVGCAQTCPLV